MGYQRHDGGLQVHVFTFGPDARVDEVDYAHGPQTAIAGARENEGDPRTDLHWPIGYV